jgi:hypothetical protein
VKRVALALALLLVPLGCGGSAGEPGPTNAEGGSRAESSAGSGPRTAAIYASVIRQLVTKDHTFGGGDPGFKVIYVMDGVIDGAGDLDGHVAESAKEPFSPTIKAELKRALSDLPPVEFVATRDAVVIGTKAGAAPGHVRNGGVLISLGPIAGGGTKVEVGNSLWISGLAGQWLTYVLESRDEAWRVVGTTGPVAIS